MSDSDDERIRALWVAQPAPEISFVPEQLRARAASFEAETARRNRIDLVSFALTGVIALSGGVLIPDLLIRSGALLLALWAGFGVFSVRRFHRLADHAPEMLGDSCSNWYRRQLESQRDIALSRPWGIALALPGVALLLIGYVANDVPWSFVAVLGGVCLFAGIAVVIHGKVLAGKWQREIDLLNSAMRPN